MTRLIERILILALAILWSIAGLSKISSITFPKNQELQQATWAAQFPTPLIIFVSTLEICIAIILIARYKRTGLALGIFLLASFSIVAILFPPTSAQTCGCLGTLASLDASTLQSRIVLLVGIHALAWASLPNKSTSHDSAQPRKTIKEPHTSANWVFFVGLALHQGVYSAQR